MTGEENTTNEVLLQIQGLYKSFGGLMAVCNVNLTVYEGHIFSVIGTNGAGKTTLFNLVTGYLPSDLGTVIFKGRDITKASIHEISHRGIGRAFQVSQIFPGLTVFENVQSAVLVRQAVGTRSFSHYAKQGIEETSRYLDHVKLSEHSKRISSTLSRGDQKRLDIAIALAGGAELLLLDEPTAGMSPEETSGISDLIQLLPRDLNVSVLFTEHDIDVVFACAQRIAVMDGGIVIAEGTPEEIRGNTDVQRIYMGA